MALLPIRKPRPFAGKKGQSIKDLYSSAMRAKGVNPAVLNNRVAIARA